MSIIITASDREILSQYKNMPKVLSIEGTHNLTLCPKIAKEIGFKEATFIQQLHYWLTNDKNHIGIIRKGFRWIYNTYDGWTENFEMWSKSTIRRIIAKLENLKIIISEYFKKHDFDQTKYYRIDYEVLAKLVPNSSLNPQFSRSAQNEQVNTTNLTTSHKRSLNKETFLKKNQEIADVSEIEKEVIQIQEKIETCINPKLDVPIQINRKLLTNSWVKFKKSHFGNLKNFLDYLDSVIENPFLMGKKAFKNGQKFILRLGWLFKWETYTKYIEKISFFKIWPTKPKKEDDQMKKELLSQKNSLEEISKQINSLNESTYSLGVRKEILQKIGSTKYYSWFRETEIEYGIDLKITTKTKFHQDYLFNNFLDKLRKFIDVPIVISLRSEKMYFN